MDKHFTRDALTIIENLNTKNSQFSGKSILLTGAAGFLGSQFIHYFLTLNDSGKLSEPCKVYSMDNFMRGIPEWLSALEKRSDLEIIKADIVTQKSFPVCNYIIHAASIASPIYYRIYPIETMDANVIGLRNLLEFAKENPCDSFLFFSTSEIYGDPQPEFIPTPESYRGNVSCTGPRACYDESKRYGETLCVNFWQQYKIPVKIARPFNNYGPGLKITDKRVLPDFFKDALNDRDIHLLSDGKATRTFCYITDAITGYLLILLSAHNGESFNIGTETPEISMLELAIKVIETTGKKLDVTFKISDDKDYLTDNPNRRCPIIEKARRLLNYSPNISLDEGLKRTYEYYLENSQAIEA
ncbi:MAG TPA: NAD-dependent epimerase/dehydratase family protein [Segetibacter sp.]|jgi:nucleoside-diphosphate-sugar epimerase